MIYTNIHNWSINICFLSCPLIHLLAHFYMRSVGPSGICHLGIRKLTTKRQRKDTSLATPEPVNRSPGRPSGGESASGRRAVWAVDPWAEGILFGRQLYTSSCFGWYKGRETVFVNVCTTWLIFGHFIINRKTKISFLKAPINSSLIVLKIF